MVTAGWVYSYQDKVVVVAALRAAGLDVVTVGAHHLSIMPHYGIALGGIALRVRLDDAVLAGEIIAIFEGRTPPKIGMFSKLFLLVAFLVFLIPPPCLAFVAARRRTEIASTI